MERPKLRLLVGTAQTATAGDAGQGADTPSGINQPENTGATDQNAATADYTNPAGDAVIGTGQKPRHPASPPQIGRSAHPGQNVVTSISNAIATIVTVLKPSSTGNGVLSSMPNAASKGIPGVTKTGNPAVTLNGTSSLNLTEASPAAPYGIGNSAEFPIGSPALV